LVFCWQDFCRIKWRFFQFQLKRDFFRQFDSFSSQNAKKNRKTPMTKTKLSLIRLLQRAHSGELAAALAYGGHWKSLKNPKEIADIRKVEADEWSHRAQIAEFLAQLEARPVFWREVLFWGIGWAVALICHFCGRFCSTYFAGILENSNVCEYKMAAEYADALGLKDFAEEFREMEATEAEHEIVLQKMICRHPFLPYFAFFFRWGNDERLLLERQNIRL
jgi:demethoxyubiquinone hydroxylase (CLK1/Coq7/Cat5 family)